MAGLEPLADESAGIALYVLLVIKPPPSGFLAAFGLCLNLERI